MKKLLLLAIALGALGVVLWSTRSPAPGAGPVAPAQPAQGGTQARAPTQLSQEPPAPNAHVAGERQALGDTGSQARPAPPARPEIIDPNHELLALATQPEPKESESEKKPDLEPVSKSDFVPDPELVQKYAGSRPEELKAMVQALQGLLDEDYQLRKQGAPGSLTEKQEAHIRHEIEWIKSHGGA